MLWLLGGAALAAVGTLAALLLLRPPAPADPSTPAASPAAPVTGAKTPSGGKQAPRSADPKARSLEAEEKAAQELYGAAETYEKANAGDPEKISLKYLEVYHHHPTTTWGRKAEQKARQQQQALEKSLEREFQGVRKDAETLAAAGHFLDAIQGLQDYLKEQKKDALRRRTEREILSLENRSRESFNRAAAEAQALAKKGEYAEAAAVFTKTKEGAILEVSRRCDEALAQLRDAGAAFDEFNAARRNEETLLAFREGPATRALGHFHARRYEEGLKEFDGAPAALKDPVAREREAAALAGAFWEAFLKALRARAVQDISIAPAGPKDLRTTGKLLRIASDRLVLDTGDASTDVLFDKIPIDQVVAWTIGKTLPAEEAATYVKAALFFFLDGRDDLARTYLATAKELGADIAEPERIFREGLLRSVSGKKQGDK